MSVILYLSKYELSKKYDMEINEGDPMRLAKDAIITIRCKQIENERENNKRLQNEAQKQGLDVKPYQHRAMELNELLKQLTVHRT